MSRYELAAQVEGIIKDFVCRHPDNSLKDPSNERAWDEPIVGFSSGADELYEFYKDHIGPFHWTPREVFSLTFPDVSGVIRRTSCDLLDTPDRGHEGGQPGRGLSVEDG